MKINSAEFVMSNTEVAKCPKADRPEYAFIGRSNVGKSSLINMLTNNSKLAKTSGKPGKTQLINHFSINNDWYLVDLPGYGYAKVSKKLREKFEAFISNYLLERTNLMNVFVLIDSRHKPQQIDLEFMQWLGENGIPFSLVFTKVDKLKSQERKLFLKKYENEMLKIWAEMPPAFVTSATSGEGKDELLGYIEDINPMFQA
ncbi:MAG: ribosome biogenesis GTP-binding protein YihA/YsxC [Flavobacteriales bacterium]|nr:ribosome biogenesis GTP-binding protein YihA/YsxC [Flavobacteriales bacterium]